MQQNFNVCKEADTHKFLLDQRGQRKAQGKKRRESNKAHRDTKWFDKE